MRRFDTIYQHCCYWFSESILSSYSSLLAIASYHYYENWKPILIRMLCNGKNLCVVFKDSKNLPWYRMQCNAISTRLHIMYSCLLTFKLHNSNYLGSLFQHHIIHNSHKCTLNKWQLPCEPARLRRFGTTVRSVLICKLNNILKLC